MELVAVVWEEVSEQKNITCWIKSSLVGNEEINEYFNSEFLAIVNWFLEEMNIIVEEMEPHEICKKLNQIILILKYHKCKEGWLIPV